ncbi:MAG: diaminopimelate decarboxylase [Rubrimonas sp.]|uniref:diaminopimelate decarboxylase n=1 Tax=Rubrimonas sp. TaxID=2036015 RepID=UPI002FDE2198
MDHFTYIDGELCAEDVRLADIAASVGTPCYVYSAATLERHYRVCDEALAGMRHRICYALKANSNMAVLRLLARLGAGMDVVSEGELRRALAAGVPGERIVFAGVGKTADEMRAALAAGVGQFNVESEPELLALDAVARDMGLRAPVAIRVNPDVDARTHAKISTGKSENKFGVPIARAPQVYALAAGLPGVEIVGVDLHIGSQLTELAPFEAAFRRLAELVDALRAAGHAIRRVDLGGGLGIPYVRSNEAPPLPFDYGAMVRRTVGGLGAEVVIEPGRLIAGNAGVLLARVIYRKQGEGRDFLILDAAMNDLIRPAMYDAWHDLVPVAEPAADAPLAPVDVVGPVCETGDTFARARSLPPIAAGDLVAFRSAGAYGAVMASEYNTRPLVPEVLVSGSRFDVVRSRPTYDEMLRRERIPDWLA